MSLNVDWKNPYAERDGKWLKGNLHTHTSPASGCGEISINDCVERYVECGYDFIAISDHGTHTRWQDPRLTILSGIEWNDREGLRHTGVYAVTESEFKTAISISDQSELLQKLSNSEGLLILNHPNWQLRPHYRREELEESDCYDGVEIYNAVIERLLGYAIATDKWDYLLAQGIKVLGFASDDSHRYSDIGRASINVRSKTNSQQDIIAAIKSGNFYSSSGASIDDIHLANGIIEIETPDAQEIQVRAYGGEMIHCVRDRSIRFDVRDIDTPYVRFCTYGSGSAMAWTQPFFLD